ncbi:cysteinyl-tRNA synthetase [Syntrophotalea carbinolica DSM 2380]|uniref:Cysteine--tRNA ligase n=1 Tax=Syntrophotalea carbinolica (strain DSM 2380 / NBRC 103641 / GraBd1) TaxID=338963 RepID=SYC_SYNC1|nr:cysteine--tRNA ligase [Syntrophotalea carbinolica]Q3A8C9.1 RecName: Full=Cysteine--tRNA ligase; AltName: Full=Cysteinyl-tRNA synthetase; Short=CysRS [Syntrophotalea carbinolica DSM 2380]ABA87363.1 cysteinyl-tRNA synthetase [Syntrophotalea carbinolica DSM 2380]
MSLRVYNTMTGRKEEFEPLQPGKVGMYVCGVTVYDYCHIGHARANVVFDIIYRYLQFIGFDVTYVRNYTDVDDKIIKRANERGISSDTLAGEFIQAFDEDMNRLGLAEPTIQPKATCHIDHIVNLVQRLIDRGIAYESQGDVYFSVEDFPSYLKLSKRNMDEMRSGARITPGEQKRNPMDFALWKAAKPGEPSWESPWGPGRPGWHIECSAMSMEYLGESFDIHGGGKDLVFPHHENEIAQSEGATGKPFVKYWLHNGFVNVNQEKMSKSLGNFFTIRDILQTYDPEVLRFFILTAHYRSPIDFSDQNLQDARLGLSRFYEGLHAASEVLAACPPGDVTSEAGATLENVFREAMDDDFNTAAAIGHLFDAVRTINRLITEKGFRKNREKVAQVRALYDALLKLGGVLGLFVSDPAAWLKQMNLAMLATTGYTESDIEDFIRQRQEARKNKDFARADEIRDELAAKGIQLLDGPQGTAWKAR